MLSYFYIAILYSFCVVSNTNEYSGASNVNQLMISQGHSNFCDFILAVHRRCNTIKLESNALQSISIAVSVVVALTIVRAKSYHKCLQPHCARTSCVRQDSHQHIIVSTTGHIVQDRHVTLLIFISVLNGNGQLT